jgi:streptogramin lyase
VSQGIRSRPFVLGVATTISAALVLGMLLGRGEIATGYHGGVDCGGATFTEFDIPGTAPPPGTEGQEIEQYFAFGDDGGGMTLGPDDALWFAERRWGKIGRIATSGAITEYGGLAPAGRPRNIVSGPDGALWFTEPVDTLERIFERGEALTIASIAWDPTFSSVRVVTTTPHQVPLIGTIELEGTGVYDGRWELAGILDETTFLISAPDRGIGTTSSTAYKLTRVPIRGPYIGKITTSGELTEYGPLGYRPVDITAGPDEALWFIGGTGFQQGRIVRIATDGDMAEHNLPQGVEAFAITAGPDGALWFTGRNTANGEGIIGRITTAGDVTVHGGLAGPSFGPGGITPGPDGALWFTEPNADKIGRMTPSGALTEFDLAAGTSPVDITTGPDGALWFTEHFSDKVGRITTSGDVSEYRALSSMGFSAWGITHGPDGALWFTAERFLEFGRAFDVIVRFVPPPPDSGCLGQSLPGRMTGGGSVFKADGQRVTHGFELHCDKSDLPNRLQVNWGRGARFHLDSLARATCTNSPLLDPGQPPAQFDTYSGSGTGRYKGKPGATAEWSFTDAGEPGTDDTATVKITDSSGSVVLDASGKVRHGNHQAHEK